MIYSSRVAENLYREDWEGVVTGDNLTASVKERIQWRKEDSEKSHYVVLIDISKLSSTPHMLLLKQATR